jgi:peroxiredoxin Q/BCP
VIQIPTADVIIYIAMLKEGDKAPDFCLDGVDEKGKEVKLCLKDLLGQNLIIYFYPKDNTPGCTQEACDFRDNVQPLSQKATGSWA